MKRPRCWFNCLVLMIASAWLGRSSIWLRQHRIGPCWIAFQKAEMSGLNSLRQPSLEAGPECMEYDDPRWVGLQGGYRIPYDPRNALHSLEANTNVEKVWEELWTELHHQGDVGEASY